MDVRREGRVRIRIRAMVVGMATVTALAVVILPGMEAFALPAQTPQASTSAQTQQQPSPGAAERNPGPADNVRVWVNTASGVYHCPGTHWYGKTKSGKFMTVDDAKKAGYKAAKRD